MHFTRYRLCKDLFGRKPGGKESRLVHESLAKLARARLTMEVWDPEDKAMGLAGEGLDAGLVASFGWAKDYARAVMTATPRELARIAGSKRGSSTYRAREFVARTARGRALSRAPACRAPARLAFRP